MRARVFGFVCLADESFPFSISALFGPPSPLFSPNLNSDTSNILSHPQPAKLAPPKAPCPHFSLSLFRLAQSTGLTGLQRREIEEEGMGRGKRGIEGMMEFSVNGIFGGLETCDGMKYRRRLINSMVLSVLFPTHTRTHPSISQPNPSTSQPNPSTPTPSTRKTHSRHLSFTKIQRKNLYQRKDK
jgi:hypothetical protein